MNNPKSHDFLGTVMAFLRLSASKMMQNVNSKVRKIILFGVQM